MRNTVPTAYTTVPTGVTVCSGHVRRNQRSRCRNPAGHLRRNVGHVPGITGHVGPEYSPCVYLSAAAFEDLLRLDEFLSDAGDPLAGELLDYVLDALQVLTHQPCIGRPVAGGLRELIISRRRSGYLARYEFDEPNNLVRVARIRHQRESGYSDDDVSNF